MEYHTKGLKFILFKVSGQTQSTLCFSVQGFIKSLSLLQQPTACSKKKSLTWGIYLNKIHCRTDDYSKETNIRQKEKNVPSL